MAGGGGDRTKKKPHRPKGGGGGEGDGCDIQIDVDLQGVRRAGLAGLQTGAVLTLRIEDVSGFAAVVCDRSDGETVGAVANLVSHSRLVACLRRGVPYTVVVTEVRAGGCHVSGGRADI